MSGPEQARPVIDMRAELIVFTVATGVAHRSQQAGSYRWLLMREVLQVSRELEYSHVSL